jgi:hypothetical protein
MAGDELLDHLHMEHHQETDTEAYPRAAEDSGSKLKLLS